MRKKSYVKEFLFVTVFAAIFLASQAVSAVEIMPVKDIKPGMKGYGYTVYKGTLPEKFEFEVLGVDKIWSTTTDSSVVLVKLTAGPEGFSPEKTGVVAGMSGSPMYIDGKLVGALAYRFGTLPKDAIAGIQPAENMLDPYSKVKKAKGKAAAEISGDKNQIPLVLSMPAIMADLFTNVDRFKDDAYFKDNFVVKPSVGASPPAETGDGDLEMQPGSSLNVYIIKGDITMSANGTVTMVEGDQIYAFGHPFFSLGEVEMPFHQAEVITTLSDYAEPYKMVGGDAGTAEGTITNDYYSAIKGKLGKTPQMIALAINMEGKDGSRAVNVEIARLPQLTVKAVDMVISSIYQDGYCEVGYMPQGVEQEMKVATKIKFSGSTLNFKMERNYSFKYYGTLYSDGLAWAVNGYTNELIQMLVVLEKKGALNRIENINIEVTFAKAEKKKDVAPIGGVIMEKVKPKSYNVSPGDTTSVDVVLSAGAGSKKTGYTMTIPVPIPNDAEPGSQMDVYVGSGFYLASYSDTEDMTLEETVLYYNNFFKPGLFMVVGYEVTEKSAPKADDSNVKFVDLGSTSLKQKMTKMKVIIYILPTQAVVSDVHGAIKTSLDVKKKEPAPSKPNSGASPVNISEIIFSVF